VLEYSGGQRDKEWLTEPFDGLGPLADGRHRNPARQSVNAGQVGRLEPVDAPRDATADGVINCADGQSTEID